MKHGDNGLEYALWIYLSDCRLRNLSPSTLEWYERKLKPLCNRLAVQQLSEVTTEQLRAYLASLPVQAATRNGVLRCIKAWLNFCVAEGLIPESPASRIHPAKLHKPVIQTLSDDQLVALLRAIPQKTFVGCRDFAIVLLLVDTGARISEALSLRTQDLRADPPPIIHIEHGKGNKARQLPIGRTTVQAMTRYLVRRRDCQSEHLFVSVTGRPLDRYQWRRKLANYGRQAGITGVRMSPHTLRHTFAKRWLLNGGDAFSLQRMLGHSTLETTKLYVQMFTSDLQQQHAKFSPVDGLEALLPVRRKRLR